jgi:tRNA uridine 5-carboxymethylaminomethyl modification enzyme
MENRKFDILVLGGGHAGVEATWAASQFSQLSVGLVSIPEVAIGSTPCNPAVGGVGKGQVVREIDALGGLMGRLADEAGIQYRILNESKGAAVQSTRVQVDKDLYAAAAESALGERANITLIKQRVERVDFRDGHFVLSLNDGSHLQASRLIMTTGTFLGGRLYTGEVVTEGGRVDCRPSDGLSSLLSGVSVHPRRFKTGTPPRLSKKSINFAAMEVQDSDPRAVNFHWAHDRYKRCQKQIACHLTRIGSGSLATIRDNKARSPLYNGLITGVGPRYCPSIEDKAFRYPERDEHHVFVEPEGVESDSIYPNGISTSLPKEVQLEFVRQIPGLESAEFLVYGYAVEYDVVQTTELDRSLQYKTLPGLYFAGQVNGTSGYEEAAGQGIVAGINAALAVLGKEPLILSRDDSYIGVMVEDLVTQRRDEPYRLFTARAENRLEIREDNTVLRMARYRSQLGLNDEIDQFQRRFLSECQVLRDIVSSSSELTLLLKRPKTEPIIALKEILSTSGAIFSTASIGAIAIECKYQGYVQRAKEEGQRLKNLSNKTISWEKLSAMKTISNECRQRIAEARPETFFHLQRIEGIRPATLAYVASSLV